MTAPARPRFGTATLGVPPPEPPPAPAPDAGPARRWSGRRRALVATAAVLLLVAAFVVGLQVGGRGTTEVWRLRRDLAAGAALRPGDLVAVPVRGSAADGVAPAEPLAPGSTAGRDLRAGELLLRGDVGRGPALPGEGAALVGVALAPGAAPDGLRAGAEVAVLRLPATSAAAGQAVDLERPSDVLLPRVLVASVSTSGTGRVVTLVVPADALGPMTALGAQSRLAVVGLPG